MSYRIKAIASGLNKDGVIENGKVIRKKLIANEIYEVQSVDESELKNYYRVISSKGRKINRSQKNEEGSENLDKLKMLIDSMESMIEQARKIIKANEHLQFIPKESELNNSENEEEQRNTEGKKETIEEQYIISEEEAEHDILTPEKFQLLTQDYNKMLQRNLNENLRGISGEEIHIESSGNLLNKKIPFASEANLGIIPKVREKVPLNRFINIPK